MTNNPSHRKLSGQFGDIIGPSDEELEQIESNPVDTSDATLRLTAKEKKAASDAGAYFTPERIEESRAAFAKIDPEYAAVRRSRGRGGSSMPQSSTFEDISERFRQPEFIDTTSSDYGLSDIGVQLDSAETDKALKLSGETSSREGGATTAYSEGEAYEGQGRRYGGMGAGGWDMDAGKRASSFDVHAPKTMDESLARAQGIMMLQVAGPTCNHPVCQAYRAKGMEMLGRGVGNSRMIGENTHIATPERPPFPSVRKDAHITQYKLSDRPRTPERIVKTLSGEPLKDPSQIVMSYGSGKTTDVGDFDPAGTAKVPNTKLVHTNDPEYKRMLTEYTAGVRYGNAPIFHPDDYMEHHHEPGEELAKLPWE